MTNKRLETIAIHDGYDTDSALGSISPPIFQTASFEFESAEIGEKRFAKEEDGFIYSRLNNPTVDVLEKRIALLEGGEKGLAFSSGMGAISAVLIGLTKANDHILCSAGLYGGTFDLLRIMQEKYHITVDFSLLDSKEEIEKQIKPETTCIYVETPINPNMKLIDLSLIAEVAKTHNIPVVVDNTFSTPYLQRPLDLGCDIVVHSATKYLNGHGDVIAGLAVGSKALMDQVVSSILKGVGSVLSPFNAWLLMRGMKTLPIRMERHCDNAEVIVEHLKNHKHVEEVFYPSDDPAYSKQMKRGGGVISFTVKGGKRDVQGFLNRLKFIKIAVSLGDAETLIEHPASMTHASIPEDVRLQMGISDNLIRLSVGLEAWEDIWEDLNEALTIY